MRHRENTIPLHTVLFFRAIALPGGNISIVGKGKFSLSDEGSRSVPVTRKETEYILRKDIDGSYSILVGPPDILVPKEIADFFSRFFQSLSFSKK